MSETSTLERTPAAAHVGMGQAAVAPPGGTLQAVVGSCIGLAVYHPRLKRSALAHVVLPASHGNVSCPAKFADTAVPHLVALLAAQGVPAAGLVAKIAGALTHTQGGLEVNTEMRVLRKDGKPLPNLFAGGGAARGLSGPSDWGYLSGSGLMTATNMGRLAGIAAAKLVKK